MEEFIKHINHFNPRFLCFRSTDEQEILEFKVCVNYIIYPGANESELQKIFNKIPTGNEQFKLLYSKMNGIKMYCQNDQPKIELFSIQKWNDENEAWQYAYDEMAPDELYDFQKFGVAFGEISQSGNYFVFYDGKIYYADHDNWDEIILGNSLFEFLESIIVDPAKFMFDRGCYSRFEDGKTRIQWIPKKYLNE